MSNKGIQSWSCSSVCLPTDLWWKENGLVLNCHFSKGGMSSKTGSHFIGFLAIRVQSQTPFLFFYYNIDKLKSDLILRRITYPGKHSLLNILFYSLPLFFPLSLLHSFPLSLSLSVSLHFLNPNKSSVLRGHGPRALWATEPYDTRPQDNDWGVNKIVLFINVQ